MKKLETEVQKYKRVAFMLLKAFPLLDRAYKALSGWKAKLLSQAGRTVLINSTLSAFPCYQMQCFEFPKGTLDEFDRIQRDFWWDKENPKKAYYPKAWDAIRMPKISGGVGIRNPHNVNLSLLTKLGWRMLNNPNDLWIRILKGKYFPRNNPLHKNRDYEISLIWHSIRKGLDIVKENYIWEVGDGRNINISLDNWIPGVSHLQNLNDNELKFFSDLIDQNGCWDNNKIDVSFTPDVACKIKSIYINGDSQDRIRWRGTKNGEFSSKSVYRILSNTGDNGDKCWQKNMAFRSTA
ncbi:uncharacterized protein LOC113331295 [Papaver somniferum]|uniref:uncharacterized protein LOC113331295 n=1 Tax=Papaver somniferum TaxID=3469 RepID=UPI000E6FB9EF|nr:uncharacterized protein LOC113331295 [Papaver somniferum]